MLRRGSNSGIGTPGQHALVPGHLEMAALEDLGPRTRYALANAPLKVLAYSIVSQIIDFNDRVHAENERRAAAGLAPKPYLDPKSPDLDDRLARGVVSNQLDLLQQDRSIEDAIAGVTPLNRQPSPKSAREQRKAERLARRARW